MMKIKISDIKEQGLRIHTSKSPRWINCSPYSFSYKEGTQFASDIKIDLVVSNVLNEINVRGKLGFSIESPCARCLVPVETFMDPEINLVLLPNNVSREEDDDTDYETYDGDEIDLSDYIREVITISIPIKVTCNENCLGLCINCGADLNQGDCFCEKERIDPRFSILKKLKL